MAGRHRPEVSARPLYGMLILTCGAMLITVGSLSIPDLLAALAYVVGGACIASALYEFTGE